ncbi:hypothetical protein U1Q18_045083, partial [Sarracenia purpurea var. burkii]
ELQRRFRRWFSPSEEIARVQKVFGGKKKKETVRRLEGAAISSDLEGFGEAPETVRRALGLQASPSGRIGLKVASGAMDLADGAVGFVIR